MKLPRGYKNIPVENLETGPDTTENINEVVDEERPDRIHPIGMIGPYEMSEEDLLYMTREEQERAGIRNELLDDPQEPAIVIDGHTCTNQALLDYVDNPGDMSDEDFKMFTREWDDIEKCHRVRKKMYEKPKSRDIYVPEEKAMVVDDLYKSGYVDIHGNISDEPTYMSMPRGVAERYRKMEARAEREVGRYNRYKEETVKSTRYPEEENNKNVTSPGFKAEEKWVPKPGTKGMMKVRPSIFDHILEQMSDVHRRKNADYGDAAHEGYKEFGIQYYIIQLHNKLQRLKSLTKDNSKPQVNESIEDTLLDLANYAVMALESRRREKEDA